MTNLPNKCTKSADLSCKATQNTQYQKQFYTKGAKIENTEPINLMKGSDNYNVLP